MEDALKWMEEGFQQEFNSLLDSRPEVGDALAMLGSEEAEELGRRAARTLLAPVLWRALAGDVFDTTQVCELLDISRQAIAKRVRHQSLLGIPGQRTTYFPVWQFDLDRSEVRPVVKDVLRVFHEALGTVDPLVVVSWSRSPQHDELEGLSPQEWIEKGRDERTLRLAAQRAATALAA